MSTRRVAPLLDQLFSFLTPERVDAIAKATGFIQRKREITASDFLTLLFQVHGNLVDHSLQALSSKLGAAQEISVSRAALDKKFNPNAVRFLQRLVEELFLIQRQLPLSVHPLAKDGLLTGLRLLDSTIVSVPDHLKARAKKTRQTTVKIQHEFDTLTGRVTYFNLSRGNINDAVIGARRVPFLEEQELCLQDLGYFHLKVLGDIQSHGGYFLSKVRKDAYLAYENPFPLYHENGDIVESSRFQRIPLAEFCRKLEPGEILELEEIHFGRDAHFHARCILFAQDAHQTKKSLARMDRRETRSRKKTKQLSRDMAGTTVYMTNLPEAVSAVQVVELYRVRWGSELMFKTMKSHLELAHFKLVKLERWLCHLYATLLVFLLSQLIAFQLRNAVWEDTEQEVSEMVATRSIAHDWLPKLYEWVRQKEKTPQAFVHKIIRFLVKTARKPNSVKGTAGKRLQLA